MDTTTNPTLDPTRALRGRVYLLRLRVNRLEGAWPDPNRRTDEQKRSVAQARRLLALALIEARTLGVRPYRRRPS